MSGLAEGEAMRNYGFTRSVIPMVGGKFHAKLEWRQDPPPAPLTAERPEYRGTSWAATFGTRTEANNALDAKIAELS